MFSPSSLAKPSTGRAVRRALHRLILTSSSESQHRCISLLVQPNGSSSSNKSRRTDPHAYDLEHFSTKGIGPKNIDSHVLDGVLNKEFPGYFDKDHHHHHPPQAPILDVHRKVGPDRRPLLLKDEEDESHYPVDHDILTPTAHSGRKLKCSQIAQVVEQHHSVDECLVVEINVQELQAGEIPVAFVVPKPDALQFIDPNNEIHKTLMNSLKVVLASHHETNHQELMRDLVARLDDILLHDPTIRKDMIRDEIVQAVRDEYGPKALVKVVLVDALPYTASGKAMRGTLYKIARGEPFTITNMIMDHEALRKIETEILKLVGRPVRNGEEASAAPQSS
jgi:hypothetical protein